MDGDLAQRVVRDVSIGISIEGSRATYDDEAREFRAKIENQWNAYRQEHPHAEFYVPTELEVGPEDDPSGA